MSSSSEYVPPKVWVWNKASGGRFANINRPIAGPTHDKELPVGKHPFQLYSLGTPNGQKVTIMFEELLARGLNAGDRVGVLYSNSIECLIAYYAVAKAGLVRVGLNTRETLDNHQYKLEDSGARCVIHADIDGLVCEQQIGAAELDDLIANGPAGACAVLIAPAGTFTVSVLISSSGSWAGRASSTRSNSTPIWNASV